MKLVDILARELSEWPDQYYQIYQDSGGNLIGTLTNGDLEDCDSEDLPFDPVTIAWDGNSAIVERAEWQAAVDALKTGEEFVPFDFSGPVLDCGSKEWTGDMPPIGRCELRMVSAGGDWHVADIKFASRNVVVWDWEDEPAINGLCTAYVHTVQFRPIRTPEQIAAEEREEAIKQFMQIGDIYWDTASALYDAGARLPGRGAKA